MPPSLSVERDGRAALGEAGDAAVALARNLVAVRRIEVGEMHLAFEARLHRPDLVGGDRLESRCRTVLFELLAAGDAGLEHLGVVELLPDRLARRRQVALRRSSSSPWHYSLPRNVTRERAGGYPVDHRHAIGRKILPQPAARSATRSRKRSRCRIAPRGDVVQHHQRPVAVPCTAPARDRPSRPDRPSRAGSHSTARRCSARA